ncbi:Group 1 truncated hemoglobin [Rubrivivax sp. A210]|uniref:group I truncated hemoglobin n=1 Tax=Rubrivivax sp. A210 TaxID=2772301 RepID=UPI00191B6C5C|nr:group 1 truncated hemoglobin [Rubrivivax sp. A210]CAD5373685.1 Group 1 truncated hemoglobin [Rubrivivax sp. A210]
MNTLNRVALRLAAAGLVSLALSGVASAADKSLYERLGGKPALTAVVGEVWNNVAADARINKYFAKTKPEVFGGQLVDFLCQASGGPCQYKGKDMQAAHTGMKLSDGDFNALAEDVAKALDKFKVPAKEKSEVMNMLGGLRGAVVNH